MSAHVIVAICDYVEMLLKIPHACNMLRVEISPGFTQSRRHRLESETNVSSASDVTRPVKWIESKMQSMYKFACPMENAGNIRHDEAAETSPLPSSS
jgi:hypothetical protein